jgi:N-acetylglucosaminyl-diphospho-decaprenol L-rhamnosyltransferase
MISVSIISHGHGSMLPALLLQLLDFPQVTQVIVTLNIPESVSLPSDSRVQLVHNQAPLGFGANHNQAFAIATSPYFCVLNPDIAFAANPFPKLLESFSDKDIGLVAPMIRNTDGGIEDSARHFPTPFVILARRLFGFKDAYVFLEGDANFTTEWVGGMCMLFRSPAYAQITGFDERYFMYVEDVDVCTRLWKAGIRVVVCPSAVVIHEARRASRRSWEHLRWHIASLLRYFLRYLGRLPPV